MSIAYKIEFDNSQEINFSELITKVFDELMKCGQEIVKDYLEKADDKILSERDKKRYRCKGIRKTAVKTKLGVIEYDRRIYFDNENHKHTFLLDENISAQKIGLVDDEMCSSISDMICIMSYRKVAETITETTGLDISHNAVWDIVQKQGEKKIEETEKLSKLLSQNKLVGNIGTKLLYEEADGDWLKLQGKDRIKHGPSKEMKIGIAYDGVIYHPMKDGKVRRELDNKVAYASFETAGSFRKHKDAAIAAVYNVDEIELRIKNGDGAQWIQKNSDSDCICVLDEYHRNKKITECVRDKDIAENLRELLFSGQYQLLLDTIEAYMNSIEDTEQVNKLGELYHYYSENFEALPDYYSRGISIPETRKPGVIHHARLGSMESNVFTIIGNRMKGGRACWSIKGGNNLAALLCSYHASQPSYSVADHKIKQKPVLSASKIKETSGNGYEIKQMHNIPSSMKWLRNIASIKPLADLRF